MFYSFTTLLLSFCLGANTLAVGALVAAIKYASTEGLIYLSTCYYELEEWMAFDSSYDYYKRVLRIYAEEALRTQIGDNLVGYQKKSNKLRIIEIGEEW